MTNGQVWCWIFPAHIFFNDYIPKIKTIRSKIKTGKPPIVNQKYALMYLPDGQMKYKCDITKPFAVSNKKLIRKNNNDKSKPE